MQSLEEIKVFLLKNKPLLADRYKVKMIGLFGSMVRGDFNNESDIDILVDFNEPVGIEFIDLAEYLELNLKRKVDLVSLNGLKENYKKIVEQEVQYV
jgi:predicted nucleotidyltransferase